MEWERVDHAVTVVGWGEVSHQDRSATKYWIVQNSWGSDWGEDGYIYILRGKDNAGVESMATYINVIVPEEYRDFEIN